MKVKELLKKILPPPVASFNRSIEHVCLTVENNRKIISNKLEKNNIEPLTKRMDSYDLNIKSLTHQINSYTDKINSCDLNIKSLSNQINGCDTNLELLNSKAEEYNEKLKLLDSQVSEVKLILKEMQNQLSKENKLIQSNVEGSIQRLEENIINKRITWADKFEKRVVGFNFGEVTAREDFEQLFLNLIRGLDSESIAIITDILRRQQQYLSKEEMPLDLYSLKEQQQLRVLEDEFTKKVFKVTDNLYCYKHYLLPDNHFEPSVFYYKHGIDELKTLEQVKNKDIIDVGGYIGDSVLVFSPLTNKNVYTFEAVLENYELMQKTFELNNIKNVVPENIGLGSCRTTIKMGVNGSGSCIEKKRQGVTYHKEVEVSVITLDEYVEKENLEVGLIKVDIEGAEQDFLKGAMNTIRKHKPILLISIYHNADDFFNIKPMIEALDLGYKFSIHKPIIPNLTSETLLLAEVY